MFVSTWHQNETAYSRIASITHKYFIRSISESTVACPKGEINFLLVKKHRKNSGSAEICSGQKTSEKSRPTKNSNLHRSSVGQNGLFVFYGSGCSAVVERTPRYRAVASSIPARFLIYPQYCVHKQVPRGCAELLFFL